MIPGLIQTPGSGVGGHVDPDTTATSPEGKTTGWTLTMSEEFNGPVIDEHVGQGWVRFREGGTVWRCWYPNYLITDLSQNFHTGNPQLPERQVYLREGVDTDAGSLTLTATPLPDPSPWKGFQFISGNINSHPSLNQTYGFFEARMWLPGGQSQWPAFWLFPQVWPETGHIELDIMECFESSTSIKVNNHLPGGISPYSYAVPGGVAAWHTYGLEWTPETIGWYVDGTLIVSETNLAAIPEVPMYPILNLAMRQIVQSTFVTKVDWVRVWQRNDL